MLQQSEMRAEPVLHVGVGVEGFGQHSSVRVWLLHLHILQFDSHIAPTLDIDWNAIRDLMKNKYFFLI